MADQFANIAKTMDIADLEFDPDVLRRKYREERDRRLRTDGNEQYLEVKGDFSHYIDDPHVEPGFVRTPVQDDVDVLVIGGGFGGLLIGSHLRKAGIERICIVEKGGDFGGTWYWNRYPGAQCDIESYIYMPLLEETGYIPTEKYTHAPEILAHAQRIATHFGLYQNALFQTQVAKLTWVAELSRWLVTTNRSDQITAQFVVMSSGPLNRPRLPGIPGIENFKGRSFHTSRWDYNYTGGDSRGNLDRLRDKRVALIGTGATGVQVMPYLARDAGHLYVFQRTACSVDFRGNRPTDPQWASSLSPGWQMRRMDNWNTLVNGGQQDVDLVSDGWTDLAHSTTALLAAHSQEGLSPEQIEYYMEIADFKKMNEVRARIGSLVKDRATAEALKPWYRQFCKRPTFNDEYFSSFNRPNVTLVDTDGRGVHRVTETGLVVGDTEYPMDCIVFATGFEVGTAYTRRSGLEIYGRAGRSLSDYWAGGYRTFHGFFSHGFPNCFHMGMTQNTVVPNFTHLLDEQARHISYIVDQVKRRGAQCVEPTEEAETEWVDAIRNGFSPRKKFLQECTPSYYNGEGTGNGIFDQLYGPGPLAFFDLIRAWRADGALSGLQFG